MHLRALYWLNNRINSPTENIRQPQSLTMQRWPCILFLGVSPDPVYKHRDKGQFLLYSGSYIAWPCVCVCGVCGSLIGLWTLNTYGHLLYRCANTLRPISTFYITWINTAGDETSVKMVWTCTIYIVYNLQIECKLYSRIVFFKCIQVDIWGNLRICFHFLLFPFLFPAKRKKYQIFNN